MLGIFAEFEWAMTVDASKRPTSRQGAGEATRRPTVPPETERTIRVALAKGRGIPAVAEAIRLRTGTAPRITAEALQARWGQAWSEMPYPCPLCSTLPGQEAGAQHVFINTTGEDHRRCDSRLRVQSEKRTK